MTVAEMIEFLKTMPQDATVQVLQHVSGHGYYDQGGWCYTTDFNGVEEDTFELDGNKLLLGDRE